MRYTILLAFMFISTAFGATVEPNPQILRALPASTFAASTDPSSSRSILLEMELYRITTNISGDTSLTDDIRASGDAPASSSSLGTFTFFTTARLQIGSHKLDADEQGWRWDGKPALNAGSAPDSEMARQIMTLMRPRLMTLAGQSAEIMIGGEQPFEFFEQEKGSQYQLKIKSLPAGIAIGFLPQVADARIAMHDFTVTTSLVEARKPVAGTSLNVGEPTLRQRSYNATIKLQPGHPYGFTLNPNDGQGMLLGKMKVSIVQ